MNIADPIRNPNQLKQFAEYFLQHGEIRNYTMIIMGIYTALRISDLLKLRWDTIYCNQQHDIRSHFTVIEQKTGKAKNIAIHPKVRQALSWLRQNKNVSGGNYIFANSRTNRPITRVQAWRIIKRAADTLGIDGVISCHSLRKTWGYYAWHSNNVSPAVITEVYNHSNYRITRRYLGIEQDDLDEAYLNAQML